VSAAEARPRGELRLTVALWLALAATIVPLLRVVASGPWTLGALALPAVILTVGFALRRRRLPAVAVSLAELAVWMAVVTAVFFPGRGLLEFIPTGAVIEQARQLVQRASSEILLGVAPLAATAAVNFVIVAALGLVVVALDHVVLTARMPLLAAVGLVAVWLIPAIAVPSGVDIIAFALLAAAVLFLIRAETRTREDPEASGPPIMSRSSGSRGPRRRSAGVTAVATSIGAIAIAAALVGAPALPPPVVVAGAGSGAIASIDPTLDLGDDLRRRTDVPVLTMYSDAPSLPYLRVATLSIFDGAAWMPDRVRTTPLAEEGFEPVVVDEGVRVTEYRTHVAVTQLASAYLPVAYPAVAVTGLEGVWRAVPYSRTVLSSQTSTQGQTYEVVTHLPRPTLEQIRDARALLVDSRVDVFDVPADSPPAIAQLAADVTAAAGTDYDKLIALQEWFRGPEFTYSLAAPVTDGFDGSSAEAVADFLDVKEGYCVHFAGSFALMARTLGMPARIVVGFLPGAYTDESVDGMRVAEATTGQLHAWPEVYFSGIGWVPFEPTKGLGAPTRFAAAGDAASDGGGEDVDPGAPTAAPERSDAVDPGRDELGPGSDALSGSAQVVDPRPYLSALALLVLVGACPGLLGLLRRLLLRRQASAGRVGAAWRLVQEAAIDLGASVPASESPRALGARLVSARGAPAPEIGRLVAAIEKVSYGPGGPVPGAELAEDARTVRAVMLAGATGRRRARALLLPRSLVVRPGSAFADRDVELPV